MSMSVRPVAVPFDRPLRLGVLISGGGTTLVNFLRERLAGRLNVEVPVVIASRPDCGGIARAREAGLRVEVIPPRKFPNEAVFSREVFATLDGAGVDLVTLAGFLSRIQIPEMWRYQVMNIHPALIPSFSGHGFYGHHVHEAVLARGAKVSGCTVHFADNEYDAGPIIVQRCVPVLDDDTADSLAARVFATECEAYPEAIRLFAQGRLEVDGARVRVLPPGNSLIVGE
jgi:formyltetrahydrofolate-dependent phosphoribosylglycinamide formyltransferase